MAACAHGADYSSCPPKKVAKEFNKHDQKTGILRKNKIKESLNDYKRLTKPLQVFDDRGKESQLEAGTITVRRSFKGQRFVELQIYDRATGSLSGLFYAGKNDYLQATIEQKEIDDLFANAAKPKDAVVKTEPTALGKMLRGESTETLSFKQFLLEGDYKIHPHYDFPYQQKKMILEIYKQADYTREKFVEMMKSRGMDVMQLMQSNPAISRFLQSLKFRT